MKAATLVAAVAPYVTNEGLRSVVAQLVDAMVPALDQRNAEMIAETLANFIPIMDQRAADIAVAIIEHRAANVDTDAVAEIARQVADDTASRALARVDTETPALDVDALRYEVIESAMRVITDYLPALVAAASADTSFEVKRDGDGRITRVESKSR